MGDFFWKTNGIASPKLASSFAQLYLEPLVGGNMLIAINNISKNLTISKQ